MTETEPAAGRARKIEAPADVRSQTTLDHVDYQDAFVVGVPGGAAADGAEQWIRAVFEGAPAMRGLLRFGWRLFGARLGPFPSPEHVVGWLIEVSEPDRVRLGVVWALGLRAQMVLRTRPSSVVLSTSVEQNSLASKIVWPLLIPVHRSVLRLLLWRAVRARARTA